VRLGLLEDQLAARVDLGLGGDVIGELEALVRQYPLREGLWCCLITALYRMGRQADALAAYTRVRELLVDELGVDPGPSLRALEEQILQQSRALDAAGSAPSADAGQVGNLPALSSSLVGRAAEVSAVQDLLRHRRLVTVVGPAGVGKTRLAIEVARGLAPPGGVWLVRLDGVDATASIPRTVAETLHLAGGEQMLVERFTGAESVLVLDNCEHVIDRVAELATELLDATTRLRVLATSQRRLDLDGETLYPLPPLPIADSVALFAARAAESRRQFVLDDETAAFVEEVCLSLDGLRWPSSWRQRGSGRSRCRTSPDDSMTASRCSRTRPAVAPSGAVRWPRRSGGATSSCSPTSSEGCGRSPASRAEHVLTRQSASSLPWGCPRTRSSMWSTGSPIDHW
jgi:hypothetical protein